MMRNREIEVFEIQLAYLMGHSARRVAVMVLHKAELVGTVHKLIAKKSLTKIRQGNGLAEFLLDLERTAPGGRRKKVAEAVNAAAMEAGRILRSDSRIRNASLDKGLERHRLRMLLSLPSEMDRLRVPLEPEKVEDMVFRPRNGLSYNVAGCSLSLLASKAMLPEWALQAGLRLRQDRMVAGAGIKSPDFKEKVDGSAAPGRGDNVLDAMQRSADALAAVKHAFAGDWLLPARLEAIEQIVIGNRRIREFTAMPKDALMSGSKLLATTLEAVAKIYDLAPTGDVAERLKNWEPQRAKSDRTDFTAHALDQPALVARLDKIRLVIDNDKPTPERT